MRGADFPDIGKLGTGHARKKRASVTHIALPWEINMTDKARSALVLQGGGALGAYELGAARALYETPEFAPDLIAGVSIGAITAALLARPGKGLKYAR
jgi:predicted acylesterase/phospholipase RssA